MRDDWLAGHNLDNLADNKLGNINGFDLLFFDFLGMCFEEHKVSIIDPLLKVLIQRQSEFEGVIACLFQLLMRINQKSYIEKMLKEIPEVVNLPIFFDGYRCQYPINIAIDLLDKDLITLLLDHGAKMTSCSEPFPMQTKRPRELMNITRDTHFYYCLIPMRGAISSVPRFKNFDERREFLQFLLGKGANLNDPGDSYASDISLLHVAVESYDPDLVAFLLEKGMHPDVQNDQLCTPLKEAVENFLAFSSQARQKLANKQDATESLTRMKQSQKILKILVLNGAPRSQMLGNDVLCRLVSEKAYPLAQFLITQGFDPEEQDEQDKNAFDYTLDHCISHSRQENDNNFLKFLNSLKEK